MLSGMGDRFSSRFPNERLLTLDHETDDDGWIVGTAQTGSNTHFASQWVQCSYSLSGGYGPTLRYIYYVFVALAVLSRRITWLTTAALGLVMTYSSAAATHALLLGLICACYMWEWTFPQLRFCPVDVHDPLPMSNSVPDPYGTGKHWVHGDPYRWNRVIGDHFVHNNLSVVFPTHCIYPCFGFSWPLRDPDEIKVNSWSYGWKADTGVADTMFNLTVTLVISSCVANMTLVIMGLLPGWKEWKHLGVLAVARKARQDLSRKRSSTLLRSGHAALVCWILLVYLYALVVSPLSLLCFVGFTEWLMWSADAGAESFKHVGQWGSLIGAVMVLGAGLVSVVTESFWYKRGVVREEVLELGETERPETDTVKKRDPGGT